MVLRVLKGIEERNSLSGKEVARSGSDPGNKIGYNGEVLAGALLKGSAVKAGEYRGKSFANRRIDPVSTLVANIHWRPGWCYHVAIR